MSLSSSSSSALSSVLSSWSLSSVEVSLSLARCALSLARCTVPAAGQSLAFRWPLRSAARTA
eukprot:5698853-Pleurochrysis_carterae.AAC.1